MPPLIALIGPALAAIGGGSALAGAVTAGSLGLTAGEIGHQLFESANPPSDKPTAAQQAAAVAQQSNQLKSVVAQNAPNYQAQADGGLSPNYIAENIGSKTGSLPDISALQDILKGGGGGGGGTNLPSGLPNAPPPGSGADADPQGLTSLQTYLNA